MGRSRAEKARIRSHTLPSSPSHSFSSSSSSDFEFRISLSPPNKSLCPADDLFYKGKLLPLHLSPRLSMVRRLLLASSSTSSSSDTTTSASRDSSGSSSSSDVVLFADYNCDSSRPSSVADLEDEFIKRPLNATAAVASSGSVVKKSRKFSLAKFSSVFKKRLEPIEPAQNTAPVISSSSGGGAAPRSVKKMSASARDVFRKYLKKVKPLYEKLSQKQQKLDAATTLSGLITNLEKSDGSGGAKSKASSSNNGAQHSFTGNLRYPRRRGVVASCPSSMRSSPSHSGVLTRSGFPSSSVDSSMEELQNAIQGAITHCKNSMMTNRSGPLVSNNMF